VSLPAAKRVHNGDRLHITAGLVASGGNQATLRQPSLAVEKEDCTRLEEMLSYTSCTVFLQGL